MIELALHVTGGFLLFAALGALCLPGADDTGRRKLGSIAHGSALLLIFVTGLGMVARNGLGFPLWLWLKIGIWLLMGAAVVIARRAPGLRLPLFFGLPLLGGIAAWLALTRPF